VRVITSLMVGTPPTLSAAGGALGAGAGTGAPGVAGTAGTTEFVTPLSA
jgi:hypothetical protein